MYGVVTLFDDYHNARVFDMWWILQSRCGLEDALLSPTPHFTWHVADQYDLEGLEPALREWATGRQPFIVGATGLGVFTGGAPVLYISLVKDAVLARNHQSLCELAFPFARNIYGYYTPENWVPHITLAGGDINRIQLGCTVSKLAFQSINWEIRVDRLALVYKPDEQAEWVWRKFSFGG